MATVLASRLNVRHASSVAEINTTGSHAASCCTSDLAAMPLASLFQVFSENRPKLIKQANIWQLFTLKYACNAEKPSYRSSNAVSRNHLLWRWW